jgi:Tfp pilus assembly protein PilF
MKRLLSNRLGPWLRMTWRALVAPLALIAGCASAPTAVPGDAPPLADGRFGAPTSRPDAGAVFALSEPMQRYLDKLRLGSAERAARIERPQQVLAEALYKHSELKLRYDDTFTRTAAQTFEARAGNCLSLVIMTAAFARALELQVSYQSALVDPYWSRQGSLLLRSDHVNVTLGPTQRQDPRRRSQDLSLTIDFLPPDSLQGLRSVPISEDTVLAMYFANLAAEALLDGRLDDAYWDAREALRQAPAHLPAANTLAVVYQRSGLNALAEQSMRWVLAHEPDELVALANLRALLEAQGRTDEAQALAHRLARLEPRPPLYWLDQGVAAMARGDYASGRDLFQRQIDRSGDSAELQFWIAQAAWRLGEPVAAQAAMARALTASTREADRARFGAKLAWLKAQAAPTQPATDTP